MKRLEVEWEDSQVSRDGWEPIAAIIDQRHVVHCRSVGYVLADDADGIVLAGSLNDLDHATGLITIPASQVRKRRRLR